MENLQEEVFEFRKQIMDLTDKKNSFEELMKKNNA